MKAKTIEQMDCSAHKPKRKCKWLSCENRAKSNGTCPKCGVHRYRAFCWKGTTKHK